MSYSSIGQSDSIKIRPRILIELGIKNSEHNNSLLPNKNLTFGFLIAPHYFLDGRIYLCASLNREKPNDYFKSLDASNHDAIVYHTVSTTIKYEFIKKHYPVKPYLELGYSYFNFKRITPIRQYEEMHSGVQVVGEVWIMESYPFSIGISSALSYGKNITSRSAITPYIPSTYTKENNFRFSKKIEVTLRFNVYLLTKRSN